MGEFELIERYFKPPVKRAVLAGGDDCALLQPTPGTQWAISTDMLVENRHFLPGADPERLGHKALAVNLSDLAACGARPVAFTLALALPAADEAWLAPFARGLLKLAEAHGCELVGGDTTAGPLNICITVFGEVAAGLAPLRSGARAQDDLWLSGQVGDARLALETLRGHHTLTAAALGRVRLRLDCPTPRVALGRSLAGVASAAIDVSDGLLGDLGHILRASHVGAELNTDWIAPGSAAVSADLIALDRDAALRYALSGGDDYELLFTAAPDRRQAVQQAALNSATPVTRIGSIRAETGVVVLDAAGQAINTRFTSFDHFA